MKFDKNLLRSRGPSLGLQEFVERCVRRLPVLIEIARGYCGTDEWLDQISAGEYYWVYGVHRQTRLVAQAVNGEYFSIPLDYPVKFNLIDTFQNVDTQCLSGCDLMPLLEKKKSRAITGELWVQFVGNKPVNYMKGANNGATEPLGPLRITDQYEQKYLLAYTVHEGYIHSRPIPIPVYLEITVNVFVEFQHCSKRMYRAWSAEVEALSQKCSKSVPICNEVVKFPDAPCTGDYEYLDFRVACQKDSSSPSRTTSQVPDGLSAEPQQPLPCKQKPAKVNKMVTENRGSVVERTPEGVIMRYQLPDIPEMKHEPQSDETVEIEYDDVISLKKNKTDDVDDDDDDEGYVIVSPQPVTLQPMISPFTTQQINIPSSPDDDYEHGFTPKTRPNLPPKPPKSPDEETKKQPPGQLLSPRHIDHVLNKELSEMFQRKEPILKRQEHGLEQKITNVCKEISNEKPLQTSSTDKNLSIPQKTIQQKKAIEQPSSTSGKLVEDIPKSSKATAVPQPRKRTTIYGDKNLEKSMQSSENKHDDAAPRLILNLDKTQTNVNDATPTSSQKSANLAQKIHIKTTGSIDQNLAVVENRPEASVNTSALNKYKRLSDVPRTINFRKLSISDVVHCFKLLNFEAHCSIASQNHIDGELLMDSIQNLTSLGFSDFEVNKLKKFVNGWRPRED